MRKFLIFISMLFTGIAGAQSELLPKLTPEQLKTLSPEVQRILAPPAEPVPLLDVAALVETLALVPENRRAEMTLQFLASSGAQWENVGRCGGWRRLENEPVCQVDHSLLNADVYRALIEARVLIGKDLRQALLRGWLGDRRQVYGAILSCQWEMRNKFNKGFDCFRNAMVMLKVESVEHSLSLLKQAALLSLLLERGGEIACFKHRKLTRDERENYDVAAMLSPLYDRDKEGSFDWQLEFCQFKDK